MWSAAPSIDSGRMEVNKGKFEAKVVQLGGGEGEGERRGCLPCFLKSRMTKTSSVNEEQPQRCLEIL